MKESEEADLTIVKPITTDQLLMMAVQSGGQVDNLRAIMDLHGLWKREKAKTDFDGSMVLFHRRSLRSARRLECSMRARREK